MKYLGNMKSAHRISILAHIRKASARLSKPVRVAARNIYTFPWKAAGLPPLEFWEPYDSWIAVNHRTEAARTDLVAAIDKLDHPPLISVVMPVYESDPELLSLAIESVIGQEYPHWELCVADDGSVSPIAKEIVKGFTEKDERIHFVARPRGGISAAANAAASIASGEILAFLDHDDLLTPEALGEIALAYRSGPDVDLVYSDHDKIDMAGRRYDPQFKPGWSPNLLFSFMYLGHLFTVRRKLFEELSGFRSAFDGAQDHDLALRLTMHVRTVVHIPRILYHWRTAPGSTAIAGDAKPAAFAAGALAVSQALQRVGHSNEGVVRAEWATEKRLGLFSITPPVVRPPLTVILLATKSEERRWRTYLRDRHSPDPSIFVARRLEDGQDGQRLVNLIDTRASGLVIVIDGRLTPTRKDWLDHLLCAAALPGVGLAGSLLTTDSRICGGAMIGDMPPQVAFLGLPAAAGGYMSLNACSREVADLTWGCVAGSAKAASAFVSRHVAGTGAVPEVYVITPTATLAAPAGFHPAPLGPRPTLHLDPYANPNLTHDRGPYSLRAMCRPLHDNAPVRVVFVSHNLDFEGAPITLRDLILELTASGAVEATVLSPTEGPLRNHFEKAGVQVLLEPSLGVPQTDAAADAATQRLSLIIRQLAAAVVVANTIRMANVVTASTRAGVSSLLLQHESEAPETYFDYLPPLARENAYRAFNQAYAVTYVADATRFTWRALERRANFRLIRNALPPNEIRGPSLDRLKAREDLGLTAGMSMILIVGNVSPRKGQLDVVKAVANLSWQERNSTRLFIVGVESDPKYVRLIRAFISQNNLADVITLTGRVSTTALYYAASDIYVCASSMESAPRVVLEAMEMGLAIITTPIFGVSEMTTDGREALHFPIGDQRKLKAKLRKCLSDPQLRRRLGGAARERFQTMPSFTNMVAQYKTLIREAAAASLPDC